MLKLTKKSTYFSKLYNKQKMHNAGNSLLWSDMVLAGGGIWCLRNRAGASTQSGRGVEGDAGVLHIVGVLRHTHHAPALWLRSEV